MKAVFNKNPLKTLMVTMLCFVIQAAFLPKGIAENLEKPAKKGKHEKPLVSKKKTENADSTTEKVESKAPEPTLIVLNPVPQHFELWVDRLGFNWQLGGDGALQPGPLSYFQSAMSLAINGKSFKSAKAGRLDGGERKEGEDGRVVLEVDLEKVQVRRDVWFDHERGGLRYIDSFDNAKGKETKRLRVQLKTSFRSTWQDLHGGSGKILGGRDSASLSSRDHAVLVKYSRTDGRPDTVFLVAGDGEVKRPKISFSSNHRELTFTYELDVPAGGKVALVHWIMQRTLSVPDEISEVLRPFYLRRRLLQPRVDRELSKVTANFAVEALPEHTVEPYSLEALVALKKATQAYGAQRLWEDVLWITGENQLAGKVNKKAKLKIQTVFGERLVEIEDVAAIQGGAGVGRRPRVFLRDGRVWAGAIVAEGLSMASRDGWDMDLKVDDLMFLLTQLGVEDGRAPEGCSIFVALRSGDVLAVDGKAGGDEVNLALLSPWGTDRLPLSEIESLRYTSGAVPKYRLHRRDGSWMSVFLSDESLDLRIDSDEAVQVQPSEIAGIWRSDKSFFEEKAEGDEWLDFEDIGERVGLPTPCCLLAGSNLLHGEISMEVLHLVSGGVVTKINPREIVSMERLGDQQAMPFFNLELSAGNRLKGRLRERSLIIKTSSRSWDIPVQHFIAYLNKEVK